MPLNSVSMLTKNVYEVRYRRQGWRRAPRSKSFGQRAAAERFIERLQSGIDKKGAPLAPLDYLELVPGFTQFGEPENRLGRRSVASTTPQPPEPVRILVHAAAKRDVERAAVLALPEGTWVLQDMASGEVRQDLMRDGYLELVEHALYRTAKQPDD